MEERIGNLSGRASIFTGSGFRASRLRWCLGISVAILFGLVADIRTESLAGVRVTRNFQETLGGKMTNAPGGKSRGAAGPCVEKGKRYVDCGNGTVTDTVTGLIWLKQSTCLPSSAWEDAKRAAAALKNGDCMLSDTSAPGDWRLPTRDEWEVTMKEALTLGCGPTLTNDAGTACITAGPSSFVGVERDYYWSSTPLEGQSRAFFGDLDHGHLLNGNFIGSLRVWPVRGGQR